MFVRPSHSYSSALFFYFPPWPCWLVLFQPAARHEFVQWKLSAMNDLKFALRQLLKNPGFTAVAVLTLALGIGANSAIFSVVNAVLFQPLPFRDPGRLTVVWHTPPQKSFPGVTKFVVSPANYLDWRDQNHVFEQISAVGFGNFNLTGMGQPESVEGRAVSADFFSLLGVQPVLGR